MYIEDRNDRLGYMEFRNTVLENLNRLVVFESYLDENIDFIDSCIFKAYEKYSTSKTDAYNIQSVVYLLEVFLDSMFKNNPGTELGQDKITAY